MVGAAGAPRPHWVELAGAFARLGVPELQRRRAEARRLLDQDGVIYNAYRESPAPGRRWLLDPLPAVIPSREWEAIETRRDRTRRAAQPGARGPVRAARSRAPRPDPARGRVRPRRLPAPVRRDPAPGAPAAVQLRGRYRARQRRAAGRDRRPRAGTVGRRLCAREPDRDLARAPEPVSRLPGPPAGAVLPRAARRAPGARAARGRGPADRRADAGPVERDRIRARGARFLARLSARRRSGPDGPRRPRVDEVGRPARAGRRDPATGRRMVLRSTRASPRFPARRARARAGRPPRPRLDRQHARLERAREPGADGVPAARRRAPARLGAAAARRGELVVRGARGP